MLPETYAAVAAQHTLQQCQNYSYMYNPANEVKIPGRENHGKVAELGPKAQ